MWRLMRQERERGATAIIVALSLVLLLGAVGMAVDLGASYAKRQELQNAADAAALAAAQEVAANGWGGAEGAVAEDYAVANVRNNKPTVSAEVFRESDTRLRVDAEGVQEHWFISVLGIDASDIGASAAAEWGNPVAGRSLLPLSLSICDYYSQLGGEPLVGSQVNFNVPGPESSGCDWHENYPPGGFGILDVDSGCTSYTALGEWAPGDSGANVPCDVTPFVNMLDETVLLPIFDDVCGNSISQSCPPPDNYQHAYHIAMYAALRFEGFHFNTLAGSPKGAGTCEGAPTGPKMCFKGTFLGYVGLDDDWVVGDDGSGEVRIIRLVN